jgi:hypothetical protein
VDDLISPGVTGPWCDIVLEEVEPSKWLHQGDMLVDIGIPMFKALLDMQNDPTAEIPVDVGTIVVMTQSCDLENRKAPRPELRTELITPSAVRAHPGVRSTIWLEYENVGDAPMAVPLFRVHGSDGALVTVDPVLGSFSFHGADEVPGGLSSTTEFIGLGDGATPGVLQPGDSARIPLWYRGKVPDRDGAIEFNLGVLTEDAKSWQITDCHSGKVEKPPGSGRWWIYTTCTTRSEDWSIGWDSPGVTHNGTLREDIQPEWMAADAWAAVWSNLQLQIGEDWGDYVEMVSDNLNFLHSMGQDGAETSDLWNSERTFLLPCRIRQHAVHLRFDDVSGGAKEF